MSGRTAPDRRLTVALIALAYFMVTLDALVVVTALPSIHRDLGGSASTLQWTVNAYNLTFATGIITAAALGDRLGRRRVYRCGLALFTAASAACGLAPNLGTLIAFRAVQGAGAAIVMPLGLTLLGIAIVTVVFNANGALTSPDAVIRGYQPAMAVAAGLSAAGALAALAIRRARTPLGPDDADHPVHEATLPA